MEAIPRMNLYRRVDHIVKSCSNRNLNCLDERATGVDDLEHPGPCGVACVWDNEIRTKAGHSRARIGKRLLRRYNSLRISRDGEKES
jgi:hypothetical protein